MNVWGLTLESIKQISIIIVIVIIFQKDYYYTIFSIFSTLCTKKKNSCLKKYDKKDNILICLMASEVRPHTFIKYYALIKDDDG